MPDEEQHAIPYETVGAEGSTLSLSGSGDPFSLTPDLIDAVTTGSDEDGEWVEAADSGEMDTADAESGSPWEQPLQPLTPPFDNFPNAAIARFHYPASAPIENCSGFFVGKKTVITAAHCLWSYEERARKWYEVRPKWVVPGRGWASGNLTRPFGKCYTRKVLKPPVGYLRETVWRDVHRTPVHARTNPAFDYAALKVKCATPPARMFRLKAYTHQFYLGASRGRRAVVTGYPTPGNLAHVSQKQSRGRVLKSFRYDEHTVVSDWVTRRPNLLFYSNETANGMSGSPAYRPKNRGWVVFGIHTQSKQSATGMRAVRITPFVRCNVRRYMNLQGC